MAEFKLVISEKSGKSKQIEVKEQNAQGLMGKKIGEKFKGELIDMLGYEFEITGGADYCGFPMRKDIDGPVRKKVLLTTGIGIRNTEHGVRKRKTICGNTIHDKISQISMKVLKIGKTDLFAEPKPAEEAPADKPKTDAPK
jgi:small subunit ribosomal protein S6e